MKYNRKDIEKIKKRMKEIEKQKKKTGLDREDENENKGDDNPDVLNRRNDTGTLYKSHMLKTAKSKGNVRSSYEKLMDKLNKEKGE
jgi:E3 ubiquitin-protein ligase DOA10